MEMLIRNLGGRKFLLAIIVVGASLYLELSGHPLTPTMAGFLASIVGLFHAANTAASKHYMDSKGGGQVADKDLHKKLDDMAAVVQAGFGPEAVGQLTSLLGDMNQKVNQSHQILSQATQKRN